MQEKELNITQMMPAEFAEDIELQFDSPLLDKENSLYLTIRQKPFDEIIAGTKTIEYRDIRSTTYKNYLYLDEYGSPLFHNTVEFPEEEGFDLYLYNNGVCPFAIRDDINFLRFKAGATAKDMDSAVVEVKSIKAVPQERFEVVDNEPIPDKNGRFCIWMLELNLGKVRGVYRKQK
jgi:hypothetical protein